jgi:hypothetical protein
MTVYIASGQGMPVSKRAIIMLIQVAEGRRDDKEEGACTVHPVLSAYATNERDTRVVNSDNTRKKSVAASDRRLYVHHPLVLA